MRHADIAMYQAKASGRDTVAFFTEDLNLRAQERLLLENNLRHAIERGELSLHYQPRIDAITGGLRGVEALLRWDHPDLGAGIAAPLHSDRRGDPDSSCRSARGSSTRPAGSWRTGTTRGLGDGSNT